MQVVILAAGMGKRLKDKTKNHTKSMVEILGKTFLEHSLDKLTKFDISRIILVTGYCGDEIKEVIGDTYNEVPVIYVNNEIYATTNNIYSLYLTKDYLVQEDTLLLESDLIYEEKIIKKLLYNPYPNLAVVGKYQVYMDGTVVKVNDNNEITAFVPKEHFDYNEINNYYKTVNIYKLSKDFLKNDYVPFLDAYCKVMGRNSYYEQVLKVMLSLEKNNLRVLKLDNEKWYEVDDLQDYDMAQTMFCDDIDLKLKKYHSTYGGYWRFEGLIDFCYLVNPYFPTKRMIAEMKNCFEPLLTSYPSGQRVHKLLLSNTFGLEEDCVLLGNGAAELINCLMTVMRGKVGYILPTFQEYPERLKKNKNVETFEFIPDNKDYSYDKKDLLEFSKGLDTLILINPDNPSGNFIPKSDLIEILDEFKNAKNPKQLILDESFVDFSVDFENNTLLKQELLNKYPNLIVIKSISKSYGVPGIRLGILASSNKELLKDVYSVMPVWNINSYGEFFLQILNKYRGNYVKACEKIAENREKLFSELEKIKFLRPIKSQANYILCEVLKPYNSITICQKLVEENLLIKDCRSKLGFNGKPYVRIAVKDENDNKELIRILESLE